MEIPEDVVYEIVDSPEAFIVDGLYSCAGSAGEHEDVMTGKVLAVAKHPGEHRMQYWLKVEYGEARVALVHMLMSCGWMSDQVILDVGNDVTFPPDPHNLPKSAESSAVPLPDLNPDDYEQEFVDPSHIEAIETNDKLKSVFPEVCSGQVQSMWRNDDKLWVQVMADGTCYGAHFLESEEGSQVYHLTCAVKLAEDEGFPPAPMTTRGQAVAFN